MRTVHGSYSRRHASYDTAGLLVHRPVVEIVPSTPVVPSAPLAPPSSSPAPAPLPPAFQLLAPALFGLLYLGEGPSMSLQRDYVGILPIAEALIGKGVGIGTALAFMMAVTALSVPEMVLLRKVMKPRLIAIFVATAAIGILLVGWMFNLLF